jgi:IclR family KDG regulon transcriptional repressor
MKTNATSYKSVSHIADIFVCLINNVNTVTEIAERCQISKSTASRLLKNLALSKIIIRDPFNQKYYPGSLITQFASRYQLAHKYLLVCSLKEMQRLGEISEETILLSVLIGIQYMNLYQISSTHEIRITADGVIRGPLLAGASAKALFSQVSNEDIHLAIKHFSLDKNESSSVIDKETLLEQIMEVKHQGYAITCGESIPGVLGISVPIKNYICPAALSIIGPDSRLRPKINNLIIELKASTSRISDFIAEMPREEND